MARDTYFGVEELNEDEIFQLKNDVFYAYYDEEDEEQKRIFDIIKNLEYPEQIPNELIYEIFAHISFTKEDFGCNIKEEKEEEE